MIPTVTDAMREKGARELCQGSPLETSHDVVERVFAAMAMEATRTATNRASEGDALAIARRDLRMLANWRKDSATYTDSMDQPRRQMDEAQVIHMEGEAARSLREIEAALSAKPDPEAVELQARYDELLFAVSLKHPGESRHETALRYIRQAETSDSDTAHEQAGGAP